ncbi:MAG: hypothetical protein AB1497_10965 [Bacillota bacterium]
MNLARMDRLLVRVVVTLLSLLAITQILMADDRARALLSLTDRVELPSASWNDTMLAMTRPLSDSLVIQLVNADRAPRALLLVNGKPVASFRNGTASATVKRGDLVEVDATAYDYELRFRVLHAPLELVGVEAVEVSVRAGIARVARFRERDE